MVGITEIHCPFEMMVILQYEAEDVRPYLRFTELSADVFL